MGVLLELRGMGCRNLEYVLQARGIDWYYFLSSCIDYQGVFKRIDLAVNDMGGLLDIEILRERYYANKVWKRSRTHEAVDSGKLSGLMVPFSGLPPSTCRMSLLLSDTLNLFRFPYTLTCGPPSSTAIPESSHEYVRTRYANWRDIPGGAGRRG